MLTGPRTYAGFGFGAIQAGLFLHEACRCGAFGRLVVAEVLPEVVASLRGAGGRFAINVAHADRLEQVQVGPVELLDPAAPADRERMIEAVAAAEEIATAVPSVDRYVSEAPGSLHAVMAEGLRRKATRGGPRAVVYAAENDNRAAEMLGSRVLSAVGEADRPPVQRSVRFLNTVIGKMSGVVVDADQIRSQGLATITPGQGRAFLVEAFNRILISQIRFDESPAEAPFRRGLDVFEEKADLLPFEEAKLYGHNATHALAAYVGSLLGVQHITDLAAVPGTMAFLRAAFVEESGAALTAKYAGADPLFTPDGYRRYADDLLRRMTNPFLRDTVERVRRHPERKLAWDDRLIGTMRMAMAQGVEPRRYAFGAAAALAQLDPSVLESDSRARAALRELWGPAAPAGPQQSAVLDRVDEGVGQVRAWRDAGFPRLDTFL